MRRRLISLALVFLLALGMVPIAGQSALGVEKQVTTDASAHNDPAIYGNKVVWEDDRNGHLDIYMYNAANNTTTRITTNASDSQYPRIYGDYIVWQDDRNGPWNIYIYNIKTATTQAIDANNSFDQLHPSIYGNTVVWEDYRNGAADVYAYNIQTDTVTRLTTNEFYQTYPSVYGNQVAYQDDRNGDWDIYTYNLSTAAEQRITTNIANQEHPSINNGRIAWEDYRNDFYSNIYLYDPVTAAQTQIAPTTTDQFNPALYDNRVIWEDYRASPTNPHLYVYNAALNTTAQVTSVAGGQIKPCIYGATFAWVDYRTANGNIYMDNLDPYVVNDATGDGISDGETYYNYGSSTTSAWVFRTMAGGGNILNTTFAPTVWWASAPGGFDATKTKSVTGDFNNDNMADILTMYKQSSAVTSFWYLRSLGNAYAQPVKVWESTSWSWDNSKIAGGDFNDDGWDDVMVFYKYGATTTGAWFFQGNGNGTFDAPQSVFSSTAWDWSKTSLYSVKNGSQSIVAATYSYGGSNMAIWMFALMPNGTPKPPVNVYSSNQWDLTKSKFVAADMNGDTLTDLVGYYSYGGYTTGAFKFLQTWNGFESPSSVFFSNSWDSSKAQYVPLDYNGNGTEDVLATYGYNGTMRAWIFASNGNILSPVMVYQSPSWNNTKALWLAP